MKRIVSLFVALTLVFVLAAAVAEGGAFTPGSYETSAQGNNGPVTVLTEISETAITGITITAHSETPAIGDVAISQLPQKIIDTQSLDVEVVSGATVTSNAILAAVEAALEAAGGSKEMLTAKEAQAGEAAQDVTADVVVVGAGSAGMAAAIEAKEQGLDVIIIEKLAMVGGTSSLASTGYNSGSSANQLKQDPPYLVEDFYKKMLGNYNALVETPVEEEPSLLNLAQRSGADCDWLIAMGADMSRVFNGSVNGPSDGGAFGLMLIPVMENRMKELGIDCRVNTKATELVVENGQVVGVKVESDNGAYTINAKAVILATGGFASNPELVDKYTPEWSGYPSTASVGATGDGLIMAQAVGAALDLMSLTGPQTVAYDTGHGAVSLTNVRYNGAILINKEGKRFVNELTTTAILGATIASQTEGHAYLVFDQVSVDNAALMQNYKDLGYFTQRDTLEELAAELGIDGEALVKSVDVYRASYDAGVDSEFGRTDSVFSRIDTAPYYGVRISPASQTTYGGIKIDLECRVLNEQDEVIPGLYAAGEAASQFGNGMTIAVVLGRLSGSTVAADLAK